MTTGAAFAADASQPPGGSAVAVPAAAAVPDAVPAPAALPGVVGLPGSTDAGALIYRSGRTAAGQTLLARRADGGTLQGMDAACISCHRPSGLGTFEGAIRVPPVAWRLLSRSASEIAADRQLPHVLGFHPKRPAYTPASFARALRDGIGADGRALSWVMPRYALDAPALEALQQYLATLAAGPPQGADRGELVFALVEAPPFTEAQADAAASVFARAFEEHNRQIGPQGQAADQTTYDVDRHWRLARWRLEGAAGRWPAQLAEWTARDRPMALLGGVGQADWSPIDRFAEQARIPLLWPSALLPPAQPGAYSLYFQRGLLLEADLIAADLIASAPIAAEPIPADPIPADWIPPHVVQFYRPGTPGAAAAAALRQRLAGRARVEDRPVLSREVPALQVDENAVAVAWLSGDDLVGLAEWHGPLPARLYLSAELAGESPALAAPLRARTRLASPWESPSRSRIAMNFPMGWMRSKGLPLIDLHLQTDAWLAVEILRAALADLVDAYYPDYLLERVESVVGHRLANAHYPRLTLAPTQHFASKGGLLLRSDAQGVWNPEGGWQVPE